MISEKHTKLFCYEDPAKIENYDKAVADTEHIWHCHHRNEEIMNCGKKELISKGAYYGRPARELIFLTQQEHLRLHMKGNKICSGKPASLETRKRMSQSHIGKKIVFSDQHNQRMSIAVRGNRWWTDGTSTRFTKECPGKEWRLGRK